MTLITNSDHLKSAILLLEQEREENRLQLKEQFEVVYTTLTPANLLRGTLSEVVSSPNLGRNLVGAGFGLLTGYLTKRLIVGTSSNMVRRVLGDLIQIGVTKLVAQNSESIGTTGGSIFKRLFGKREG